MTENDRMGSNPLFTRREILQASGKAALAGIAAGTVSHAAESRPRLACVVTYWAAPGSHADWIITKLLDGYWWKGAHTPSRVDVVSVYIHQLQESGLGWEHPVHRHGLDKRKRAKSMRASDSDSLPRKSVSARQVPDPLANGRKGATYELAPFRGLPTLCPLGLFSAGTGPSAR